MHIHQARPMIRWTQILYSKHCKTCIVANFFVTIVLNHTKWGWCNKIFSFVWRHYVNGLDGAPFSGDEFTWCGVLPHMVLAKSFELILSSNFARSVLYFLIIFPSFVSVLGNLGVMTVLLPENGILVFWAWLSFMVMEAFALQKGFFLCWCLTYKQLHCA